MVVSVKRAEWQQRVASALHIDEKVLTEGKPEMLGDAQVAKHLGVDLSQLTTPFQLTPAAPRLKGAYLDLYSPLLVLSEQPAATGLALFSSSTGNGPGASISFPRLKKGQSYLVEFHVQLFGDASMTFQFQTSRTPDVVEEISLSGAQAIPIVVLIPPFDQVDGAFNLWARLEQENDAADDAGWVLYSVRVSATQ